MGFFPFAKDGSCLAISYNVPFATVSLIVVRATSYENSIVRSAMYGNNMKLCVRSQPNIYDNALLVYLCRLSVF